MIIKRPLTEEQLKKISDKEKPSPQEILQAQDQLFMYLLQKVELLENSSDIFPKTY